MGNLRFRSAWGSEGISVPRKSLELASLLKERYITEIRESIALLERFKGFIPDGSGSLCVHDSEGEHWINQITK